MLTGRCLVFTLAMLTIGCAEKSQSTASNSAHAAEDGAFCVEHGVLEAVCTKCNAALIPVFQAKGDWCDEHGYPESFCPICHPERGGKPAVDVGTDEAPADGVKVRFRTKEAATLAGIEVATAKNRVGGTRIQAIATVTYDATHHAEINARAPGVVQRLMVDLGSTVKAGAALASIESAVVGAEQSRLRSARTQVKVARTDFERQTVLRDKGVTSDKEALAAMGTWEDAKAELDAARATLKMVGASGESGGYILRAPFAGIVTARNVTVGHMVDLEEVLFEIVDTTKMWVEIDLPEDRLMVVNTGQAVAVVLDAIADHEWRGTIDYIAPAVDPRTRTARARIALNNPDGHLRANMYGTAFIELGDARPTVTVPKGAIQRAAGATLVFVRLADDVFEARRVRVGVSKDGSVELLEGVALGEPVAVKGSFLLKTETLKGSIGAGCCDVE